MRKQGLSNSLASSFEFHLPKINNLYVLLVRMNNIDQQKQQAGLDTLCRKVKTKTISIVQAQTRAQKIHAAVFGKLAQYTG